MAKRSRGDGSVYLRRDGRYEIAVIDPDSGRRHRAYARTESEANALRRSMGSQILNGRAPMDSAVRLDTYVARWFVADADLRRRPSTVREYKRRLDHYVVPTLGRRRLRDLTTRDIETLMDQLRARGLARESIRGAQNALAAVLTDAVRARLVTRNVAREARLPDMVGTPRVVPATPEQVGRLLVEARGTDIAPLLLLVAHTGCRVGEALGAQWGDVDLEARRWIVSRTITRDLAGAACLGDRTKSGGERVLPLPEEACQFLRVQRAEVARARLRAGRLWNDHDLVFPSTVGTAQDPNNVRSRLRPIAKRAGFPASFHALRHFMVSAAAASGAHIAVVSKLVGHSRHATTTDLYMHLFSADAVRVSSAVSSAVNAAIEGESARLGHRSEP